MTTGQITSTSPSSLVLSMGLNPEPTSMHQELQERLQKRNVQLRNMIPKVFYTPEPGKKLMDRTGMSTYKEILNRIPYFFPEFPDVVEGSSRQFCIDIAKMLKKEMVRLGAKYAITQEDVTKFFRKALALSAGVESDITDMQVSACDIVNRLSSMLESQVGLYRDLKQIETRIEALEPRSVLLKGANQQIADEDCQVIQYPNVFDPNKPIEVKKNWIGWKRECQMMEDFYKRYSKLLFMHLHYLRRTISILHELREQVQGMQNDFSAPITHPSASTATVLPTTTTVATPEAPFSLKEQLDALFTEAFYTPPANGEAEQWDLRTGISSYGEVRAYARTHLPSAEGLEETNAGIFCKRAIEELHEQLQNWDDKYEKHTNDLTLFYSITGLLLEGGMSKETRLGRLQDLRNKLDELLSKDIEEGLDDDFRSIEELQKMIAPIYSYLATSRRQMQDNAAKTVEFVNVFHPESPIIINKESPTWKEECVLMEKFYKEYSKIISMNAYHLTEILTQFMKLRSHIQSCT